MPTWMIPAAMLLIALLTPLLAWWGSTRYFAGVITTQQEAAVTWREAAEHRLFEIEKALRESSYAVLKERVDRADQDIQSLRKWRHEKADPYIGAMDMLKARVDSLDVKKRP